MQYFYRPTSALQLISATWGNGLCRPSAWNPSI